MMLSFNNEDAGLEGEHQYQEQRTIQNRPQTVSSFSSIDTTGYEQSDGVYDPNTVQQSALPSLPPLTENSGTSTVVSAHTSADTNFGLTTNNTTFISGTASVGALESMPSATSSTSLSAPPTMHITSSTGVLVASTPNTNTVPEFLYQLTKMLTDNNRDIIEWSNGKIEVHSPHKLESHVLNRYFRHSKFASFQRQLNYFGFRKLAGKGKMAPCSYVNDATTDELGSLLLIKRKQGNEPKKAGGKKRDRNGKEDKGRNPSTAKVGDPVNPVLAGILHRSSRNNLIGITPSTGGSLPQSQKALARVAVGKGVRHGYVPHRKTSSKVVSTQHVAARVDPSPVQDSLNALTQNFNQSMHETVDSNTGLEGKPPAVGNYQDVNQYQAPAPAGVTSDSAGRVAYVPGSLHRDDSLVDLAMIPIVGNGISMESNTAISSGFSFVDFPFDSNIFSNEDTTT